MSIEDLKNVKPKAFDTSAVDDGYLTELAALPPPKPKKSVMPVIAVLVSTVFVFGLVIAWAIVGRGVRKQPEDTVILVSDTETDKEQGQKPSQNNAPASDDKQQNKDDGTQTGKDTVQNNTGSVVQDSIGHDESGNRVDNVEDDGDLEVGDDLTKEENNGTPQNSGTADADRYIDDEDFFKDDSINVSYVRYFKEIAKTENSVIVRAKKSGNAVEVIKSFYGDVKKGDVLTLDDASQIKNDSEYILVMKLADGRYTGLYSWRWMFEIKKDGKAYFNELSDYTIDERILYEFAYSEFDKNYVPPKPENVKEFTDGYRRVGLYIDKELSYFKYNDDVFPHYTEFSDVDIYSTEVTDKTAIVHNQKTAPLTPSAYSYYSHLVQVCDTPEKMKNNDKYDIVVVQYFNGRREVFYKRKTAVYFENEYFIKAYIGPDSSIIAYRPDDPTVYFKIYYDESINPKELDGVDISRYFIKSDEKLNTSSGEITISYESVHPISKEHISRNFGMI